MSDTTAAATLTLEISTEKARGELELLEKKYEGLLASLKTAKDAGAGLTVSKEAAAQIHKMSEEAAQAALAIKALQAQVDALNKTGAGDGSGGKIMAAYTSQIEQGRVTVRQAVEGVTKDQIIEQAKQEASAKEHAASMRVIQTRDTQVWKQTAQSFTQGQTALAGFNKEVGTLAADWSKLNQTRDLQSWKQTAQSFTQGQTALANYGNELTKVGKTHASFLDQQSVANARFNNSTLSGSSQIANQIKMVKQAQDLLAQSGGNTALAISKQGSAAVAAIPGLDALEKKFVALKAAEDAAAASMRSVANASRDAAAQIKASNAFLDATPRNQARTVLVAAKRIEQGRDVSLFAPEAVSAAQSLGSTQAAQKALDALTESNKKLPAAVKASAEHQLHWNKAANEAHALARGLSGSLGTLWMTYGSIAPLMAGAALGAGFVQAAKQGAEFAYQLTFVKALGEESASAINQLSEASLSLGKSSLQGPGEIASGFRILAQAGLAASDALRVMPDALHLATVGEMNMEQAATTLVGVMNAFSLSVDKSSHVGDIFAKAAALSQTSVQGMTEAMKTASVVGEQYGASIEDTATAITLLAKVNITGTAAGTSLRNMLKELYTPVPQASAAMRKLGLETKDAMGNMKPFPDIIYDLKERLKEFDKSGQTQILQRIFGERGAKEAIAMLSKTREEWEKLASSIKDSDGFMDGVSDALENTAKGKWLQAINTLKSELIGVFQDLEPEFKGIAEQMQALFSSSEFRQGLSSTVSAFGSLLSTLVELGPQLIKLAEVWVAFKAGSIAAALLTAGAAATAGSAAFTAFSGSIAASSLAMGGAMGPVAATATKAGALGTAFTSAGAAILAAINPVTLFTTALVGTAAWVIWQSQAEDAIDRVNSGLKRLQDSVADVDKLLTGLQTRTISGGVGKQRSMQEGSALRAEINKYKDEVRAAYGDAVEFTDNLNIKSTGPSSGNVKANPYLNELRQALLARQERVEQALEISRDIQKAEAAARKVETASSGSRSASGILGGKSGSGSSANSEALQTFRNNLDSRLNFIKASEKMEVDAIKGKEAALEVSSLQAIMQRGKAEEVALRAQAEAYLVAAANTTDVSDKTKYVEAARLAGEKIKGVWEVTNTAIAAEDVKLFLLKSELAEQTSKAMGEEESKALADYVGKWTTTLTGLVSLASFSMSEVDFLKGGGTAEEFKTLTDAAARAKVQLGEFQKHLDISRQRGAFRDDMAEIGRSVSAAMLEIQEIEGNMDRDGGWVARLIGSEETTKVIDRVLPEIRAKMDTLKAELALTGVDYKTNKDFIALEKQYGKFANYVTGTWKDITKSIDGTVHQAFSKIFSKGKTDWKAFGREIGDNLKTALLDALYQVFVRKWVFSVVADVSQGAGWTGLASAALDIANGRSVGSGGGAGGGTNYLGMANNASTLNTAYGLYSQGWGATAGNMLSGAGNLLGSSGIAAYGSGYSAGLSGVSEAIAAYNTAAANAVAAGEASQALIYSNTASSLAAGGSAPGAGAGSGASGSGMGASAVGWVAAIVMGMYMSGEAWQNGIRWENYAKDPDAKKYDAEVGIRALHDEPARAIFGDKFVESKVYAVLSGSSLSAQIHGAVKKMLWGGEWEAKGKPMLRGTFSESEQGFTGQEGQKYEKEGGWFRSDKKKTEWRDTNKGLDDTLDSLYRVIRNSLVMAGENFGDTSLAGKLSGFSFSTNQKNTSNMAATVDTMSDQLAQAMGAVLFPSINLLRTNTVEQASALRRDLEQAKRSGNLAVASNLEAQIKNLDSLSNETWSGAFGRILQESQAVNRVFDLMGTSISEVFGSGNANRVLLLSDALVQMFGGVDKLNESFGAYYANFYSQEEQRAQAMEDMGKSFEALNVTMPTTREGFRAMVDGLDLATVGGQATFKAMMDLQGGFANLVPALESTSAAINQAAIDLASLRKSLADKYAAPLTLADSKQQITDAGGAELLNFAASADVYARLSSFIVTADKAALDALVKLEPAIAAWAESLDTAAETARASAEAAAQAMQETHAMANEAVRANALAALDAQRAGISAYSSAGVEAMQKAVDLEKQRINVMRSVAAESASNIKSVFGLLKDQVASLYDSVASTQATGAAQGREFITNALGAAQSTGYLPDQEALSGAISSARGGLNVDNFATQFEADKAALVMAGQLSQLQNIAGQQLPAAEQAVKIADEQLKALDDSLLYYRKQLDALNGIKDTTLDLTGSVDEIGAALISQITAMSAALNASIVSNLKSGAITSQDAVSQLGTSGVATDTASTAGGSAVFTSQFGASLVDGVVRANNGFSGTITEAKDAITEAFNTLAPKDFRAKAIEVGVSAAMIDYLYSFPAGHSNKWAAENGLASFAVGTNYVPHDMVANIHEGEAIVPKAYNPAAGGGANARLEKLVEGLTAEVQRLQSIVDAGNKHASRTANAVNGNPEQPMLVETV